MRLDQALAELHHLTRNRAQQLITLGLVTVNGQPVTKSSYLVKENDILLLKEDKKIHWVSRSAQKLDGFFEQIPLTVTGKRALDVGSSTGGFTEVLLERGVTHVDAVDVGTDQLHVRLRTDPRIHLYEQTDIRAFSEHSSTLYDIIVCDASFISLREILPAMLRFADEHTDMILLFKPQFEVGALHLKKTGVPKDPKRVEAVMQDFETYLAGLHIEILHKIPSSLTGEAGNQEWLYHIKK